MARAEQKLKGNCFVGAHPVGDFTQTQGLTKSPTGWAPTKQGLQSMDRPQTKAQKPKRRHRRAPRSRGALSDQANPFVCLASPGQKLKGNFFVGAHPVGDFTAL
ncbi:hypothetical protein B9Z52_09175 [Limnohabitans sp. Jir72]|nr:hypothetical protein B9Z52_09175 [Limnohabitans sp. Jir72]